MKANHGDTAYTANMLGEYLIIHRRELFRRTLREPPKAVQWLPFLTIQFTTYFFNSIL
jgi:hypothetical protein